jgi:predicted nucleic acid-binding protein
MEAVVVDACTAGAWLLPDEHSAELEPLLEAVLAGKLELAAPELWIYEVTNLLVSALRRNRISDSQLEEGLHLISSIPCTFFDHRTELATRRTAKLALRFSLSAYDAAYLELADRIQARLRSTDKVLESAYRQLCHSR